eukprot:TRINITY_DN5002_c0_g1_i6.p1 TRINITY_DN5002_c0_g1~~TRINITY_DN5002_c0_g1_i6.p1  ORF type:complete len:257 (+),score=46.59 TRINITY_DN5002_c0_g1_i6:27-797(+)
MNAPDDLVAIILSTASRNLEEALEVPQSVTSHIPGPYDLGAKSVIYLREEKSVELLNQLPKDIVDCVCELLKYLACEDFCDVKKLKEMHVQHNWSNAFDVTLHKDPMTGMNYLRRSVSNQRSWNYWSMMSVGTFEVPFTVEFKIRINKFEGTDMKITVVSAILRNCTPRRFAWMWWNGRGFTVITESNVAVESGWHDVSIDFFPDNFVVNESGRPSAIWDEPSVSETRNVSFHFQNMSIGSNVSASVDVAQIRVFR